MILEEQGMEIDKLFPKQNRKSTIDNILEGVLDLWNRQITEDFEDEIYEMGFSLDAIKIIKETYVRAFEFNDFNSYLKSIIKEKYQGMTHDNEAEKYLAAVLTQHFNEFIGQFGVNELELEVFENVKTLQPQLNTYILQYLTKRVTPDESIIVELFDKLGDESLSVRDTNAMVDGFNNYLNKLKIAMLSNCGFVHYDIEQNNELFQLVQTSRSFMFEVD
jgi:hypothetical protein